MDKGKFISFLLEFGVVQFGEFLTKSGRVTPYFINTGKFDDSRKLSTVGEFYAKVINDNFGDATLIFGPAYKGIPLSVVTAMKLYEIYGKNVKVAFNRKEAKDHGEGGSIVGEISENDRIVIVEDVITSGLSIRESINIIRSVGNSRVLGVVVSVDRMELGNRGKLAKVEIEEDFDIRVFSVVTILDILNFIKSGGFVSLDVVKKIEDYISTYKKF
ncbi:MAG: orotate phosphoribosyltransferase [Brevinematia bacterium]